MHLCRSDLPVFPSFLNFLISVWENARNFSALVIKEQLFKVSFLPLKHCTFAFLYSRLLSLFSAKQKLQLG